MKDKTVKRNPSKASLVIALIALLVSLAMLSLTGCAGKQDAQSDKAADGSGDALTKISFVLDYAPNTNHTGIYVAQDLGYYEQVGLDVEIVQPPEDGADALVASGNAELGMSYQDVMANYLGSSDPLPVTAVAAVIQHNTSGIISRAEDGIERPSDMQNKRYATWDQAVEQAIVKSVIETDGGDFSTVELIPVGMSDEVSGLRADMFDTVWCYEAWAGQNAAVQGFDTNYFSFRDIDERFDYYTPVIIANDEFLATDPDAVKAFLEATERGYQYAASNPSEAADILINAVPELDEKLIHASQEYLADKYIADAPKWGYIDPARWNAFYAWMNDQGLTEKAVPLDSAFSNDYLPE